MKDDDIQDNCGVGVVQKQQLQLNDTATTDEDESAADYTDDDINTTADESDVIADHNEIIVKSKGYFSNVIYKCFIFSA